MTNIVTYIDVQPNFTVQAIALVKQYRKTSRRAEGISGIDAFQEIHRRNRFVIIETWISESSFQLHENDDLTAQFRSKLSDIHNSPYDQRVHHGFAIGPRPRPAGPGALFVVTHVDVPPPRRDETEGLLKSVAEKSRRDEGNVQYDVFQQSGRTNHFTVVAAWNDESAFDSHETKPHTRQFREALGPMLGALYDERLYNDAGSEAGE